jgi:hypothetical protein
VSAESDCMKVMLVAEDEGDYAIAALAALRRAEMVSPRSPMGALILTVRAQVYATLHQAQVAGR